MEINLSKEQAEILSIFYEKGKIEIDSLDSYKIDIESDSYKDLKEKKFLIGEDYMSYEDAIGIYPTSVKITSIGKAAYEKYCTQLESHQREKETLNVAKEANRLSEEANEISKQAIKKSKTANIISIIACAVSLLSILAAVLIGIYC